MVKRHSTGLTRGTFDVILLDMNLPDMTGYDVLSSARRRRIETPCLLLTAENSSAAIAPVSKAGRRLLYTEANQPEGAR